MNAYKTFKVGRYGPKLNPSGAQVVWDGKLWDVTGSHYRQEAPAGYYLNLCSFNREHTAQAPMSACEVLERDYPETDD